jgi:hypothetical protein
MQRRTIEYASMTSNEMKIINGNIGIQADSYPVIINKSGLLKQSGLI